MAQSRLDKIIASTGCFSRREVKNLVRQGRVWVDGVAAAAADMHCDPEHSEICVDGAPLIWREHVYLMLHKPAGILSATEDRSQQTVLDLLPAELRKRDLFPVGRLDKDTEGLLLLTDDGALGHALLAPQRHVDKVYYTRVRGRLEQADVKAFAEGLQLGDGLLCRSAGLEIISTGEESEALVTIHEGKFHQIKRMLACREKPVLYLKRIAMGSLTLDPELAAGTWRYLTKEEETRLKKDGTKNTCTAK